VARLDTADEEIVLTYRDKLKLVKQLEIEQKKRNISAALDVVTKDLFSEVGLDKDPHSQVGKKFRELLLQWLDE
jgi:hypothetical protein